MIGKPTLLGAALGLLILIAGGWNARLSAQTDPVIGAAGDIACDPGNAYFNGRLIALCQMKATSDLLIREIDHEAGSREPRVRHARG